MSDTVLRALIIRRKKLQDEYDRLIAEPESYSIQGSVSATNRKLDALQNQIDIIDRKIVAASGGDGIKRSYPNYNN